MHYICYVVIIKGGQGLIARCSELKEIVTIRNNLKIFLHVSLFQLHKTGGYYDHYRTVYA